MQGEIEIRFVALVEIEKFDQDAIDDEIVKLIQKIQSVVKAKEESFVVETAIFPDVETSGGGV